MIEWKKYDETNPPQLGIEILVFTADGHAVVARLEKWDAYDGRDWYVWVEPREEMTVTDVTHYADINCPGEENK